MKKVIAFGIAFMPFIASAQAENVGSLIVWLGKMLGTATTLILAAAVVYFLWNTFKFVMAAGDEEKRKEGQQGIIYGLIGIAVMVSVYGLVNFFTSSAGLSNTGSISAPSLTVPTSF
ncbi:MAG: hypothetical protein HZB10_01840 [Candidatus Yonathbacteria bacterium]|nr:hypothetical protein [Candidatus Yonathbacteria bacterium]